MVKKTEYCQSFLASKLSDNLVTKMTRSLFMWLGGTNIYMVISIHKSNSFLLHSREQFFPSFISSLFLSFSVFSLHFFYKHLIFIFFSICLFLFTLFSLSFLTFFSMHMIYLRKLYLNRCLRF